MLEIKINTIKNGIHRNKFNDRTQCGSLTTGTFCEGTICWQARVQAAGTPSCPCSASPFLPWHAHKTLTPPFLRRVRFVCEEHTEGEREDGSVNCPRGGARRIAIASRRAPVQGFGGPVSHVNQTDENVQRKHGKKKKKKKAAVVWIAVNLSR